MQTMKHKHFIAFAILITTRKRKTNQILYPESYLVRQLHPQTAKAA